MGKTINTRIQLKSDTENNWSKARAEEGKDGFIPLLGEAIVYMGENGHGPRIKIGDGKTNVVALPFLEDNDTIYTASNGIKIAEGNIIQHEKSFDAFPSEIGFYKIKYDQNGHINGVEEVDKSDITNLLGITPGRIDSVQITAASPLVSSDNDEETTKLTTNISFEAQSNNTVLAGPEASGTGVPSFRALIENDIPGLSASKITSGTFDAERIPNLSASKITSDTFDENQIPTLDINNKTSDTLNVTRGGTGLNTIIANQILIGGNNDDTITQIGVTAPGNTDTFTSYIDSNPAPSDNLIVNLKTLKLAIPPMNKNNPINTSLENSYTLSYYAPTSKGTKHSVLIAQGTTTNSDGTEPLWLDPTALAGTNNAGHGGTLFYGRNTSSNAPIKPFETQWGTLPVEQGGSGATTFTSGNVLVGNGTSAITTIVKTDAATAKTLVWRDSNADFSTNLITLNVNTGGIKNNSSITTNRNVITIDNTGISTHYGNLEADNLTATIGTIKMSATAQPIMEWYKNTQKNNNLITEKIGSLYWAIENNRASFLSISKNDNDSYNEIFQLPAPTATDDDVTYNILTTKDIPDSGAGAFYSVTGRNADLDGSNFSYGTLPVSCGGTGKTTPAGIYEVVRDNGGDDRWVNVSNDTITGQLILSSTTALSSGATSEGPLVIGTKTGSHLAFDYNSIMAKSNTSVADFYLNKFGGNIHMLKANDTNYYVAIRSTATSSSTATGALRVSGGIGITGASYFDSTLTTNGNITVGTTSATAIKKITVQSTAGDLYLQAGSSATANRTLSVTAHGTESAKDIIVIDKDDNVKLYGSLTGNVTGNASTASLLKPIDSTTTESASIGNIPSGSKQVWGERFSDTTLKYTNSNNEQVAITNTGDWTIWLTPNTSENQATLNMRIDGTYYGTFEGDITGNVTGNVSGNVSGAFLLPSTDSVDTAMPYSISPAFKVYKLINPSNTTENNGSIFSITWDTKEYYGSQLFIDKNPTYNISFRQRNSSGVWQDWKRIPMGDGTGASGNWGINITGEAATVSRATFGDRSNAEHNANNINSNGLYYYNSNGPTKGENQFAATNGAIYCQVYDTSWVAQIAQDYVNGALAVRGKNNNAWTTWYSIPKMIVENYPALLPPNNANNWIKIGTANDDYGLLPSQSGGAGSGHNSIGKSDWYWGNAYIDNIHGNADTASKLIDISSADKAASNSTKRYVWISYADNKTGRPAYTSNLTYQTSTNTLYGGSCLYLCGDTNATMTSASTNPRITFSDKISDQPVHLIYTDYDNYRSPAGLKIVGGTDATPAWLEVEGQIYAAGFNGNATTATTATQILDAGNKSSVLTISYHKTESSATDWLPMHASNGNLVPVSSTNLANKIREKASGTWNITASENVAKTGGIMTGNLDVQKANSAVITVKDTSCGHALQLGSWSNGEQGLWSLGYWNGSSYVTSAKYLIYRKNNASGDIIVNGSATGLIDAGKNDHIITIKYYGSNVAATDYLPMYDTSGDLVCVSSSKLADKLPSPIPGKWWPNQNETNLVPKVKSDGVMEIGKYIDFHKDQTTAPDFDIRLEAKDNGILSIQKDSNTNSKATLDAYISTNNITDSKIYRCKGYIITSSNDSTIKGYGHATIVVMAKIVIITFDAKITNVSTASDKFTTGLWISNLRSLNGEIPVFKAESNLLDGLIQYYDSNGVLKNDLQGYAGVAHANNEYGWAFGRVHTTSGDFGLWPNSKYVANDRITGTLYGFIP